MNRRYDVPPVRYTIGDKTIYTVWSDGYEFWYAFYGDDDAEGPYATQDTALAAARTEFDRRNRA